MIGVGFDRVVEASKEERGVTLFGPLQAEKLSF